MRYGIALKLEDLFTDYIKNIEICIGLLGRNNKKDNFDDDFYSFNEEDKLDNSISTICSIIEEDKVISTSQKYHERRLNRLAELNKESIETKEKALEELK